MERIKLTTMKSTYTLSFLVAVMFILMAGCSRPDQVKIESPDGNISFSFMPKSGKESKTEFSVAVKGKGIILNSECELFGYSGDLISDHKIEKVERNSVKSSWENNFGEKRYVPDNYNQAKIYLVGKSNRVNFICRVYNEGVAIAYEFSLEAGVDSITLTDEKFLFRFPVNYYAWSAARAQAPYSRVPLSQIENGCERPLVIEYDSTLTIALTEAKLIDFARMKYEPDTSGGISIRSRLGSEVKMPLPFQSPWRVVMIGKNPGDLLEKNYLILDLNDPSAIRDVSWIRPGKALREVTLTNVGARAAIDFTSSHNMQYVEFDAGWYGPENNDGSDARAVNLDPARSKGPLDLKEIITYANSKNIGILLYVNRRALEKQLDELLPIYKNWGIAGIKFGFVQVGTQQATAWLHDAIKKVASYQMIADVHDEYRPTGFSRTYPNFLTMEGIRGDEESPTNSHTLITMFTRMLSGQGDNTICYYNDRVDNKMGSHASQLAKAVCLFSPLQFIYWYDKASPSLNKDDGLWGTTNYIGDEPELEFFDNVPTVWDDTKVLHAKIGEYGVIARRKGEEWFIGGINGEEPRTLDINFRFLNPDVKYLAKIYSDDPLVNSRTHVRMDRIDVDNTTIYPASLAPNNGIALHIVPVK
jgi:alpha-glucosidase